jgi:hypothetical protein
MIAGGRGARLRTRPPSSRVIEELPEHRESGSRHRCLLSACDGTYPRARPRCGQDTHLQLLGDCWGQPFRERGIKAPEHDLVDIDEVDGVGEDDPEGPSCAVHSPARLDAAVFEAGGPDLGHGV